MAEVFLAQRLGEGGFARTVAIKTILAHGAEEEAVRLFLDEARVAAPLEHVAIVQTIDLGYENDTLFIVMEYVPGPTLSRLVRELKKRGTSLNPEVVANIGARVALCGLISEYNAEDPPPGPRAFGNLLIQRALVKGFIVLDHFGQAPEAITEIAGLMQQGKLKPLETVVEGFEQLPTAINMLFDGKNVGKLVVKVG